MKTIAILANAILIIITTSIMVVESISFSDMDPWETALYGFLFITPILSIFVIARCKFQKRLQGTSISPWIKSKQLKLLWITIGLLALIFIFPPTRFPGGRRKNWDEKPVLDMVALVQRIAPVLLVSAGLFITFRKNKQGSP